MATGSSLPQPAPTRIRWAILCLACAASWLLYVHRYSWSVIRPYFKKENPQLSETELGWLDGAFQAPYAIGQVPLGVAGDLLGARAVLAGSIVLWSLSLLSVAWVVGYIQAYVARSAFGVAQSGTYPILSKMTRNWFPVSIRTSAQGLVSACGRIGAACCFLIVGYFLIGTLELAWQTALLAITIPGLALAVGFWIVVRNSPREHPWTNAAEQQLVADGAVQAVTDQRPQVQLNRKSIVSFSMLLLYAFASTFQDQVYVNLLPTFLQERHGLTAKEWGLLAPLPLIGGAIGGVFGGVLNDRLIRRWGNRRWARALIGLTGKLMQAVFVILSVLMGVAWLAMAVLFTARFFGDWSLSTQWGAITDIGGRASATIFGLVNTVGAVGGAVAGPVFGALKDRYEWEGVFAGAAVMCLVAGLCWLFIDCTRKVVSD